MNAGVLEILKNMKAVCPTGYTMGVGVNAESLEHTTISKCRFHCLCTGLRGECQKCCQYDSKANSCSAHDPVFQSGNKYYKCDPGDDGSRYSFLLQSAAGVVVTTENDVPVGHVLHGKKTNWMVRNTGNMEWVKDHSDACVKGLDGNSYCQCPYWNTGTVQCYAVVTADSPDSTTGPHLMNGGDTTYMGKDASVSLTPTTSTSITSVPSSCETASTVKRYLNYFDVGGSHPCGENPTKNRCLEAPGGIPRNAGCCKWTAGKCVMGGTSTSSATTTTTTIALGTSVGSFADHKTDYHWPAPSPILNQGGCGSCYVHAATGHLSDRMALHGPSGAKTDEGKAWIDGGQGETLSTGHNVKCAQEGACDGGNAVYIMTQVAHIPGDNSMSAGYYKNHDLQTCTGAVWGGPNTAAPAGVHGAALEKQWSFGCTGGCNPYTAGFSLTLGHHGCPAMFTDDVHTILTQQWIAGQGHKINKSSTDTTLTYAPGGATHMEKAQQEYVKNTCGCDFTFTPHASTSSTRQAGSTCEFCVGVSDVNTEKENYFFIPATAQLGSGSNMVRVNHNAQNLVSAHDAVNKSWYDDYGTWIPGNVKWGCSLVDFKRLGWPWTDPDLIKDANCTTTPAAAAPPGPTSDTLVWKTGAKCSVCCSLDAADFDANGEYSYWPGPTPGALKAESCSGEGVVAPGGGTEACRQGTCSYAHQCADQTKQTAAATPRKVSSHPLAVYQIPYQDFDISLYDETWMQYMIMDELVQNGPVAVGISTSTCAGTIPKSTQTICDKYPTCEAFMDKCQDGQVVPNQMDGDYVFEGKTGMFEDAVALNMSPSTDVTKALKEELSTVCVCMKHRGR